jgi:hypothetical protein
MKFACLKLHSLVEYLKCVIPHGIRRNSMARLKATWSEEAAQDFNIWHIWTKTFASRVKTICLKTYRLTAILISLLIPLAY